MKARQGCREVRRGREGEYGFIMVVIKLPTTGEAPL